MFSEREREVLEEFDRTGVEPTDQFFRTLKSRIINNTIFVDYFLMRRVKARLEGRKL